MTTYHFEEESSEMSNIRRTDFSSRWENNDCYNDAIKKFLKKLLTGFPSKQENNYDKYDAIKIRKTKQKKTSKWENK